MNKYIKLLFAIALCQLAGILGSFATVPAISGWYATIVRPEFSPPNFVFAPVWITLYTLMGIALFFVWQKLGKFDLSSRAVQFFSVQLALNTTWSFLFFGLRSPMLAFIEIIFLWIFIVLSIIEFYKIDKRAAYLLIPYILWVSFAGFLNFSIWMLNP